jgi:hypothetical protein
LTYILITTACSCRLHVLYTNVSLCQFLPCGRVCMPLHCILCCSNSVRSVQVAAGVGFTLFLVEGEEADFTRFPTWKAETVDNLAIIGGADDEDEKVKGGAKRKAPGAKPAAAKKGRK